MDGVQRYIANADDRPADEVERADAALLLHWQPSTSVRAQQLTYTFIRQTLLQVRELKLYWRLKDMVTRSPSSTASSSSDLLPDGG